MARLNVLSCVLLMLLCVGFCKGKPFWCVVDPTKEDDAKIQGSIDFVCSKPVIDCGPINPGGPCYEPNNYFNHGSYALNLYYMYSSNCPNNIATVTPIDPSYPGCHYPSREFVHKPEPSMVLE